MQFGKGKPFLPAFIGSALIAAIVTTGVHLQFCITMPKSVTLFFGLFGTILLASAFSPNGQVPPQGNIFRKITWFFKPQGAMTLNYNRPAYYLALLFLAISFVLGAIWS